MKKMIDDSIQIRMADESDIPLFQDIFRDVWINSYSTTYPTELVEIVLEKDNTSDSWKESLVGGTVYFLAYLGDTPVAMAGVKDEELVRLAVKTEHSNLGIGKKMMDHRMNYLISQGYSFAWFDSSLQSVDFHTYGGFEVVEEITKDVYGYEMKLKRMRKEF